MTVVVDTSAILAILFGGPERDRFRTFLDQSMLAMSTGSVIETMRVVLRRKPRWRAEARLLLDLHGIEMVPVDATQVGLAEEGALRFGKGRAEPPTVLDFGDRFAYALARHLDAPLLFKGDDLSATDVKVAPVG